MPSDFEMEDSDSSSTNESLNVDPSILASVTQGRPRVVSKGKEYQRHYGSRAARVPSVIWNTGEEYERNGKKYWRCGICKKTKMLAILDSQSSPFHNYRIWQRAWACPGFSWAGQALGKSPDKPRPVHHCNMLLYAG